MEDGSPKQQVVLRDTEGEVTWEAGEKTSSTPPSRIVKRPAPLTIFPPLHRGSQREHPHEEVSLVPRLLCKGKIRPVMANYAIYRGF